MKRLTDVHGYPVNYEDTQKYIQEGISYLGEHLTKDEAHVFFDEAKLRSSATFLDRYNHKFIITYDRNMYVVVSLAQ